MACVQSVKGKDMRVEGWKLELKTTREEHIRPKEDFGSYLNSANEDLRNKESKENMPIDA